MQIGTFKIRVHRNIIEIQSPTCNPSGNKTLGRAACPQSYIRNHAQEHFWAQQPLRDSLLRAVAHTLDKSDKNNTRGRGHAPTVTQNVRPQAEPQRTKNQQQNNNAAPEPSQATRGRGHAPTVGAQEKTDHGDNGDRGQEGVPSFSRVDPTIPPTRD